MAYTPTPTQPAIVAHDIDTLKSACILVPERHQGSIDLFALLIDETGRAMMRVNPEWKQLHVRVLPYGSSEVWAPTPENADFVIHRDQAPEESVAALKAAIEACEAADQQ